MPNFGELLGAEILNERETRGWTQVDLALKACGDEDSVRRIRNYEKGNVTNPQARTYQPLCDALGITRARINALKAEASNTDTLNDDEIATLRSEKGSLETALANFKALTHSQLIALADLFDHENPNDATIGALIEFLTEMAGDYRALKAKAEAAEDGSSEFLSEEARVYRALMAQVGAIEDGLKRLSNLKSDALTAIDAGDLDEVEEILSRVQEVELEGATKTAELRANNALLRGRTEQAFRIFSAAADSFAAVDPIEPARRRILTYFDGLHGHGLRYDGTGIQLGIEVLTPCLTEELRRADSWLWAAGHNCLGIGKQQLGSRTDGPVGADLLAQAVAAYRNALEVYTRDAFPVDWAMTQNNLGHARQIQANRTAVPAGANLLTQAVVAYRNALEIRTRGAFPVGWATTQNNLAVALQEQGCRTDGPAGGDLLAQAVAVYRAALEVRTRDAFPVDWAATKNNLGNALQKQGSRTDGPAGADLLAQAVAAYRAALEVRTRDAFPVDWAMTTKNLALVEEARADHASCTDLRAHLDAALTHVAAALEVFDPEHTSYNFESCTRVKARIEAKIATLDTP